LCVWSSFSLPGICSRRNHLFTSIKTISFMGVNMGSIVCERPVVWQPKEVVDLGNGCRMGITSDDGYYLVLSPSYTGSWKPSNWIPPVVAKRLGELAAIQIAIGNHSVNKSLQLPVQPSGDAERGYIF
jgi:hypothetical protein